MLFDCGWPPGHLHPPTLNYFIYRPMPTTVDKSELAGLSYAELRALLAKTQAALTAKRDEELKVMADGYAKKLVINGFSVAEGIGALRPYLPVKAAKQASTSGAPKQVKYANPDNAKQTWVGMGKPPGWFKDQLASGRTRDDLLVR